MRIGVNYPWLDYGWDFGTAPPNWRPPGTLPRWYDRIDDDLRHLQGLGVSVVRWFILGDGLTYGTGPDAPIRDPAARRWHFRPPPLDAEFLDHFEELLRRICDTHVDGSPGLQLLPVLVDFHFCRSGIPISDAGWVKGGRADAIADPAGRRAFLDRVLDPLLRVCERRRDAVYAWELFNEPEWVTLNWRPLWRIDRAIDEDSMRIFLTDGQVRIREAGFKATVGFATSRTLLSSGITSDISQFHHYPAGKRTIVAPFSREPAIIGEFATTPGDRWPDLGGSQSLLDRLTLLESLGYALALPWSFLSRDRHSAWSIDIERDLERFARRVGRELSQIG